MLRELKKLDDKVLLVEVQLMESQVYYRVGNLQKSRAALTSSRTTANSIYCPPRLQASLDLLSGRLLLHLKKTKLVFYSTTFSRVALLVTLNSYFKKIQLKLKVIVTKVSCSLLVCVTLYVFPFR